MRKTRDLFKKIRDTKGTFHAKMGTIKDRNGMDLNPGLGSFSRADRGIGGVRPVAPPTWLVSNFLVRPASS